MDRIVLLSNYYPAVYTPRLVFYRKRDYVTVAAFRAHFDIRGFWIG